MPQYFELSLEINIYIVNLINFEFIYVRRKLDFESKRFLKPMLFRPKMTLQGPKMQTISIPNISEVQKGKCQSSTITLPYFTIQIRKTSLILGRENNKRRRADGDERDRVSFARKWVVTRNQAELFESQLKKKNILNLLN